MRRIGISSPAFCFEKIDVMFKRIAANFERWEIVGDALHFLPDVENVLADLIPSYDLVLTFHAPISDVNIASVTNCMRRYALEAISTSLRSAMRLDIDLVSLHPGYISPAGKFRQDRVMMINRESLIRIAKEADELGITLGVENLPRFFGSILNEPEELMPLLEEIGAGLTLDIGHANQCGNLPRWLPHLRKAVNLHVHDNRGDADSHLPVGEGEIDYQCILSQILPFYEGPIIHEVNSFEDGLRCTPLLEKLVTGILHSYD